MRKANWKRWMYTFCSGACLLQISGCTQNAIGLGSLASIVTAGGVIYLVRRVMQ